MLPGYVGRRESLRLGMRWRFTLLPALLVDPLSRMLLENRRCHVAAISLPSQRPQPQPFADQPRRAAPTTMPCLATEFQQVVHVVRTPSVAYT